MRLRAFVILKMKSLVIMLLLTSSCSDGFFFKRSQDPAMLRMLDGMQQLATGGGKFDRDLYKKIRSCMSSFDRDTPKAQDAAWQGIIDFWDQRGAPNDAWGVARTEYLECNITKSNVNGMEIYEPCGYTSNIAYFHSLLELCRHRDLGVKFSIPKQYITAIGKTLSSMSMASSFFHGSNTKVGFQQDVAVIAVLAYLNHQASLSGVPYSSVLHDLSETPRPRSGIEMADDLQNMYYHEPSSNWFNITEALKLPNYELVIGSLLITVINNNFDPYVTNQISSTILNAFSLSPYQENFLMHQFLPELQKVRATVNISPMKRESLTKNSIGIIMKLFHSLLWIEQRFNIDPLITKPLINSIGGLLLPGITTKANSLLSYEYFDKDFQMSRNVYPGEQWCNPRYPHAKWHVLSALTLVDLVNYSDEIHQVLSTRKQ